MGYGDNPQVGLHEDVLALDYDNEYANLIVNHNLSYETVEGEDRKGLLPTVVERFLKRRLYFKRLLNFRKTVKNMYGASSELIH